MPIALEKHCRKAQLTPTQDKIIFMCHDNSIILFNIEQNALFSLKKSPSSPSSMPSSAHNAFDFTCSQNDAFFAVSNRFGSISLYDYALAPIDINQCELHVDDFRELREIKFLNNSILALETGSANSIQIHLVFFPCSIDTPALISAYLTHNKISEAIVVLRSISWNHNSYVAYYCLNLIFNTVIKERLNADRELQLEATLAAFFTPSAQIDSEIFLEYKLHMHFLAKRFFYHLLRYNYFDKAYLLAIDLQSEQLFLQLHKLAKEKNLDKLAQMALWKAQEFEKLSEKPRQPLATLSDAKRCSLQEKNNNIIKCTKPALSCRRSISLAEETPNAVYQPDEKSFGTSARDDENCQNFSAPISHESLLNTASTTASAAHLRQSYISSTFSEISTGSPTRNVHFGETQVFSPPLLNNDADKVAVKVMSGNDSERGRKKEELNKSENEPKSPIFQPPIIQKNNLEERMYSRSEKDEIAKQEVEGKEQQHIPSLPKKLVLFEKNSIPTPPALPARTYRQQQQPPRQQQQFQQPELPPRRSHEKSKPPELPPKPFLRQASSISSPTIGSPTTLPTTASEVASLNLSQIKLQSKIECIQLGIV